LYGINALRCTPLFRPSRAVLPRQALRGGIQKSIFKHISGNRGTSRPTDDKSAPMAPRTHLRYPHEGPSMARPHAGRPTSIKLTCWVGDTNPPNLGRKKKRAHQIGEAKSIETELERSVFHCRTTSASTAPCTSRRMCCPAHCASYCVPCQPLLPAFSGWIRSPPPTDRATNPERMDSAKPAAPCRTKDDCWRGL
jgi:hypothetical protein